MTCVSGESDEGGVFQYQYCTSNPYQLLDYCIATCTVHVVSADLNGEHKRRVALSGQVLQNLTGQDSGGEGRREGRERERQVHEPSVIETLSWQSEATTPQDSYFHKKKRSCLRRDSNLQHTAY